MYIIKAYAFEITNLRPIVYIKKYYIKYSILTISNMCSANIYTNYKLKTRTLVNENKTKKKRNA